MKRTLTLLAALVMIAALVTTAQAHWPTTLSQNVPVAAMPYTIEKEPKILPYPDDGILVSWYRPGLILCYQIVDKFGKSVLYPAQRFIPSLSGLNDQNLYYALISDQRSGAIAVFTLDTPAGHFAQRIDSLGNRLWGDDGVQVFWYREPDFNIVTDRQGGFWLGVIPDSPTGYIGKYYVQHVDSAGILALGDSGRVAIYSPDGLEDPDIVEDGAGGCFILWEDHRSGYGENPLFLLHLDDQGNQLWPQEIFLCNGFTNNARKMIYDGEGGVIFHNGPNLYRISGNGQILWARSGLGNDFDGKIMLGESGFFYIGYYDYYSATNYSQRYDLNGNTYWADPALIIFHRDGYYSGSNLYDWHFSTPYFYTVFGMYYSATPHNYLLVQRLDISGIFSFSESGLLVADQQTPDMYTGYINPSVLIDKEGGIRLVWCYKGDTAVDYDIYAKRCNADGTLGGPFPLTVKLIPQSPSIQIPHSGGSFNYNLTITNQDSIGGEFDKWVMLTYPDGTTLDLSDSLNLQIGAGDSLVWNDLIQDIPGNYPEGTYTYTVLSGKYPYHSSWGDTSFTFEKLPDTTGVIGNGNNALPTSLRLTVIPNPFNNMATIRIELPRAGLVTLEIFDINGRRIAFRLSPTRFEPGIYDFPFDGSDLASGVYILRLTSSGSGATPTMQTQKMTVLK
jgi:hypothetical protein